MRLHAELAGKIDFGYNMWDDITGNTIQNNVYYTEM